MSSRQSLMKVIQSAPRLDESLGLRITHPFLPLIQQVRRVLRNARRLRQLSRANSPRAGPRDRYALGWRQSLTTGGGTDSRKQAGGGLRR